MDRARKSSMLYLRKIQKFVKNKKRRKPEKELQHFQELGLGRKEYIQIGRKWRKCRKWRNLILHI